MKEGEITFMKTISVRISDEEKEMFDARCEELDLTMSHVLRKFIRDFIKDKEGVESGKEIG